MVIAADGVSCISASVDENITVTTSCVQGVLSADGQTCVVPRIDQPEPAAPATQPAPAPAVATTGSTVVFTG